MIWLALGVALSGYFVGAGLKEVGRALTKGFELLAETSKELE